MGATWSAQVDKEIKAVTDSARDIMESLKDPTMVRNIENFIVAAEEADRAASKIENS